MNHTVKVSPNSSGTFDGEESEISGTDCSIMLNLNGTTNSIDLNGTKELSATEVEELREQVKEMEQNMTKMQNENENLRAKNAELKQQNQQAPAEVEKLNYSQNWIDNHPKNHWCLNKSASEFFIFKPNYLKVIHRGAENSDQFLFAEFVLVPHFGIVYYEIKIIRRQAIKSDTISIGLWSKSAGTFYRYYSDGTVYGHNANGFEGFPSFEEGDTVGFGANLTSMEAIYTKNGQSLDMPNVFVFETDLLPYVFMFETGDIIEANFGPNFAYKSISDIFTKQRP
ncbi:hypothetical protein niasHT_031701 [Heterodera trifolii]|uniref:B30.2/SPRY domain-containing protein n=1 Tax=Heterodera trifolii TaxID=157864 RepID=A0ABD2IZQ8_9BILA